MNRRRSSKTGTAQTLKIAVAADCDARTVAKFLDGHPVSPRAYERVRGALDRMGLAYLAPVPAFIQTSDGGE